MTFSTKTIWLIPLLPLLAAGLSALLRNEKRSLAAGLAIGSMVISFLLSCIAFAATLQPSDSGAFREALNFPWLEFGESSLQLGFVLDPLAAIMLVMVTFVGTLIFIFSVGYMAHDENFKQFFCFLSLFAAAMLGIIIANSLLLLFICWELVGLASYLLIGFWFHKPSAAAAAKKAFITTRIGDIGLFIGMIWLYSKTGTLLFYDNGNGCLEEGVLKFAFGPLVGGGVALLVISLLIFWGAMGKSCQVPLHVWLPDAMEGPTPVSALIHAATMVAAGVFLVARVFPLMKPSGETIAAMCGSMPDATTVITWVGALTAVFAALIAVAQTDIKRILAYSTVSQLGYMMMGLGTGGVAVGMFHLITHAFFKALLFLGSGSVIHGCHEEQDIRKMGGLKKYMPVTFATYAIGMAALAGVIPFAGFWSKDEILHAAHTWSGCHLHLPFYLGLFGAFLTAFYMTRQVCYVFFGKYRGGHQQETHPTPHSEAHTSHSNEPHESPRVMTVPLVILAVFAVGLGFIGTPFWPWFEHYLNGENSTLHFTQVESGTLILMLVSTLIVAAGIFLGWKIYSKATAETSAEMDPLEKWQPAVFHKLQNKFFIDELYGATVIRLNFAFAKFSDWLDRVVWTGVVNTTSHFTKVISRLNRTIDEDIVNTGFDHGCNGVRDSSSFLSKLQDGQVQNYLRVIGVALIGLLLFLIWGGGL